MRVLLYGGLAYLLLSHFGALRRLGDQDEKDACLADAVRCVDARSGRIASVPRLAALPRSTPPELPCRFIGSWQTVQRGSVWKITLDDQGRAMLDTPVAAALPATSGKSSYWMVQSGHFVWRHPQGVGGELDINRILGEDERGFVLEEMDGRRTRFDRLDAHPSTRCSSSAPSASRVRGRRPARTSCACRAKWPNSTKQMVVRQDALTRTVLKSPVHGVVKSVKAGTIGGVVGSGAPILEISPIGPKVLVEARIKPKDIGFVRLGQTAEVKLAGYDFNTYGGLEGKVSLHQPRRGDRRRQERRRPLPRHRHGRAQQPPVQGRKAARHPRHDLGRRDQDRRALGAQLHAAADDEVTGSAARAGAKGIVETMGAGIPVLIQQSTLARMHSTRDLAYPEALWWQTPDDFVRVLCEVTPAVLAEQAQASRRYYEEWHHPRELAYAVNNPRRTAPLPPMRGMPCDTLALFLR
ncbi:hypothetical protein OSTOST_05728 [Ostertagia ostertagi]